MRLRLTQVSLDEARYLQNQANGNDEILNQNSNILVSRIHQLYLKKNSVRLTMINIYHAMNCLWGFHIGLVAGEVCCTIFAATVTWNEKNLTQYYRGISDGFDSWYLLCYLMTLTRIISFSFLIIYFLALAVRRLMFRCRRHW